MLVPGHSISVDTRRRHFRELVKICGEYDILPSSHIIPESKVRRLNDSAVSSGRFNIWRGEYESDKNNIKVAIKVMRCLERVDIQPIKKVRALTHCPLTIGPHDPQNFRREVVTWKHLSHPNILELIGVMMNGKEFCMVSPWMENGNIVKFSKGNREANPLRLARSIFHYVYHSVDSGHS